MKLSQLPLLKKLVMLLWVPRRIQDHYSRDVALHLSRLERQSALLQQAVGRIEARQIGVAEKETGLLQAKEFQVFSQSGEDGIIQHLISSIPIANRIFVEFGVEDYTESNTRFLLLNNGWSGFVADGNEENIERIRASCMHWPNDLRFASQFITRENVNEMLAKQKLPNEIGLLSIDIDGNDYWVWEAIECVSPAIVAIEYNFRFGPEASVTIPYRPDFDRKKAHPRLIYFGASLAALCKLGARKGYNFVGSTRNGVNAFFVRQDLRPVTLPAAAPSSEWRRGKHAEGCGWITERPYVEWEQDLRELLEMPLVEV